MVSAWGPSTGLEGARFLGDTADRTLHRVSTSGPSARGGGDSMGAGVGWGGADVICIWFTFRYVYNALMANRIGIGLIGPLEMGAQNFLVPKLVQPEISVWDIP